jgi:hypothetical protein
VAAFARVVRVVLPCLGHLLFEAQCFNGIEAGGFSRPVVAEEHVKSASSKCKNFVTRVRTA